MPQTCGGHIALAVGEVICVLGILAWTVFQFAHTRYSLTAWNALVLLLWFGSDCVSFLRRRDKWQPAGRIAAAFLAVTVLFLIIVRPLTGADAQDRLIAQGYQDVRYAADQGYPTAPPADSRESGMGYYWFWADKDGQTQLVAVSVTTGAITA